MKEVEFTGLDRLKERGPLRFSEEINAIRRYSPLTTSFPPNKVNDEVRDLRSPNSNEATWIFDSFFSHSESYLDNELNDPFEEDSHQGQLTEDRGSF